MGYISPTSADSPSFAVVAYLPPFGVVLISGLNRLNSCVYAVQTTLAVAGDIVWV